MLHRFYVGIGNQPQGNSPILHQKRRDALNLAATFFGGATPLPTARGAWQDGPGVTVEDVDIYEVYTDTGQNDPYLFRFHAYLTNYFEQKEVLWLTTCATRRDNHD